MLIERSDSKRRYSLSPAGLQGVAPSSDGALDARSEEPHFSKTIWSLNSEMAISDWRFAGNGLH